MNQSLKNLGIMFLFGVVVIIIVVTNIGSHFEKEYDKDHPKTKNMEELKTWAQTTIIKEYCENYSYAKSIQNETKQQRELSRVENMRLQFVPQLVRNVIEENDLPDSYADELFYYVDAEINKCQ